MKNKQHEYLLRAFCKSCIPESVKINLPAFVEIDSVLGGWCTQVLHGNHKLHIHKVLTKEDKSHFAYLINHSEQKTELIVYYRLMILVEEILLSYYAEQYG